MRKMVDKIKVNLPKIKSPILLINSKTDYTALFENHNLIKNLLTTKKLTTLVLERTNHNIFDSDSDEKPNILTSVDYFIKENFDV